MPLTKTQDINVHTIVQISAATLVNTAELSVANYLEVFLAVNIGRDVTTALTVGVIIRVQGNPKSTGNDQWQDIRVWQTGIAAASEEAVNGTAAAGQAVIGMASTTGFAVEDVIFIKNSTIANSEFHRIKAVTTNTNVTVDDNLTNAQTGATCYDQAERFADIIPCLSFSRLRVQIDNVGNASQTICAEAKASAGAA